MEKEYWLNKWQSNDIGFHGSSITPDLITYSQQLKLQTGDYIFVPLCGKTKDMLWLADQGYCVIGMELSPIACNVFFEELKVVPKVTSHLYFKKFEHNNITLLCGNLFNLSTTDLPHIHAVYDSKALIALSQHIRKKYVDHLVHCIGTHSRILLITRETSCEIIPPPYSVDSEEISFLYGRHFNHIDQVKHLSVTNIPERLKTKGYVDMIENVYIIS